MAGTLSTIFKTLAISAIPLLELRVGIPFGITEGLHPVIATTTGIAGNLAQVPLILFILHTLKSFSDRVRPLGRFFAYCDRNAMRRSRLVTQYGWLGLMLMVAIPLPGSGIWMGALVAQILALPVRITVIGLSLGVMLSGILIGLAATGMVQLLARWN
ncbi:MAG: small multi-drug export protein [Thermaerobacterales bacterium]